MKKLSIRCHIKSNYENAQLTTSLTVL